MRKNRINLKKKHIFSIVQENCKIFHKAIIILIFTTKKQVFTGFYNFKKRVLLCFI